jgi:hypothetical protein
MDVVSDVEPVTDVRLEKPRHGVASRKDYRGKIVQGSHQEKANHEACSRCSLEPVTVALRHHLVEDDVEHGAAGESERIGKKNAEKAHQNKSRD